MDSPLIQLHLGGIEPKDGWVNLNIQPGPAVDIVGTCDDLSMFADGSCSIVYASHVLEHLPLERAFQCLKEVHRVLGAGGQLMVSVPNIAVIMDLFSKTSNIKHKFYIMKLAFGGGVDPYDHHNFGYDYGIMRHLLSNSGFSSCITVDGFGLFSDTSTFRVNDVAISLNLIAIK